MSQANVELVKRGYDLWNAREMDAAKVMFAPGVMMSTPPDWPDEITSGSRDEAFARLAENRSLFESDTLAPERWIDAGECVIVPTRWYGVPKRGKRRGKGPCRAGVHRTWGQHRAP